MVRGARGRGRPRGRGRGRAPVAGEDVAQSATVGRVEDSRGSQVGAEDVAGVPAGAAGVAAGDAQAREDRLANLLTLLLERLPAGVAAPAPVVPPVVEVQPRVAAVAAEELPSYLRMMEQMQRIGTGFFSGGAKPEDADAWRLRLERNFLSSRCPAEYQVDIAVHYLEGDAHLWWRSVAARRVQAEMAWTDFVEEFNSKYFPQEAFNRLEARYLRLTQGDRSVREYEAEFTRLSSYVGRAVEGERGRVQRFLEGLRVELRNRCLVRPFGTVDELVETAALLEAGLRDEVAVVTPSFQAKKAQQQSGPSKGGKPMQGQKRKWDDASRGSQGGRGCFGCGSKDHRVANYPQKGEARVDTRVCYHCREVGHIKPKCPKLQQREVSAEQSVRQIAAAPRVYAITESGEPSSRPITGIFLDLSKFNSCGVELFALRGG